MSKYILSVIGGMFTIPFGLCSSGLNNNRESKALGSARRFWVHVWHCECACPPTRTHAVSSFRFFQSHKPKIRKRLRPWLSSHNRLRDQQQERTRWNQVAVFGLWLSRVLERVHGGRDERRETTRKRLMNRVCVSGSNTVVIHRVTLI